MSGKISVNNITILIFSAANYSRLATIVHSKNYCGKAIFSKVKQPKAG